LTEVTVFEPLKTFGHTREDSPEFLRALMARVVPGAFLLEAGS
jgi:hypothetical protein